MAVMLILETGELPSVLRGTPAQQCTAAACVASVANRMLQSGLHPCVWCASAWVPVESDSAAF